MTLLTFVSHHYVHVAGQFLHTYGYAALFFALVIEYLVFLIPGETFLIVAAAYAATGRLSLPLVILAGAAGAAIGLNNAYWIGRRGGRPFLARHAARFRISQRRLDRLESLFHRHGAAAVFWLRFVTVLRILVGYLAGIEVVPYGVFTVFNVMGALAWATVIGVLGYSFAHNLPVLRRLLTDGGLVLFGLVVVAGVILWRRREQTA